MFFEFSRENSLGWSWRIIMAEKWSSICALHGFRWTSDVTFIGYMYKFWCTKTFGQNTFPINCNIKDLDVYTNRGTLFCLGYFQAKYLLHNNLQPQMITSYSLLQTCHPTNYSNFSSVYWNLPQHYSTRGQAHPFWRLLCNNKAISM